MVEADASGPNDGMLAEKKSDLPRKQAAIRAACQAQDYGALVAFADSDGGLINDQLRATAWPLLLRHADQDQTFLIGRNWQDLPQHADEEQVQKDVDRAFVYYPSNQSDHSLELKRKALLSLIVKVLRCYPMLHYFQGYHDIVQVFLLVLGEEAAFEAVARVSLLRIRDYMLESLGPSTKHLLLIPPILKRADPKLADHLGDTPPYFALSAVLTLYAHDIQEYADIARLYDFILAHEPVMTIYLFTALVVSRRDELLCIESGDHDMILFLLSKLPQPLKLEPLIQQCLEIYRQYPPEVLPGRAWHNISNYSVLKTAHDKRQAQSLAEAEDCFRKQSLQLAKEQRWARLSKGLQSNRKPIISIGVTVLVGIASYYLRRTGHDRTTLALIWRISDKLFK